VKDLSVGASLSWQMAASEAPELLALLDKILDQEKGKLERRDAFLVFRLGKYEN